VSNSVNLWVFYGLLVIVAGGGAALGALLMYLRMTSEEVPDDGGASRRPFASGHQGPSGGGGVGANGEPADVPALPAAAQPYPPPVFYRYAGEGRGWVDREGSDANYRPAYRLHDSGHPTLERLPVPDDWESTAEEVERLERRLVALSGMLAAELEADIRATDALLESGALAVPEWVGAR
jgi:hypothetical protein